MKTISLKKVAVIAVASMGFGLLSVVPVNAAQNSADINTISLAKVTTTPTTGAAVAEVTAVAAVGTVLAAYAGITDKSPNPSEATATADTFFNEIVFTIFLSFSQIKDDLLSGWWYWDTH